MRRCGAIAIVLGWGFVGLRAAPGPPPYSTTLKELPRLWREKFPVPPLRFESDVGREVIRAYTKEGLVYYYRFLVHLPRPIMTKGEVKNTPGRNVELWLRFRPGKKEPYDLTFVRRDLLPGRSRTVLKLRD